jgi:hypothetical protein
MNRWEYNTVVIEPSWGRVDAKAFQAKSDDLGRQGWELVSVFGTNEQVGKTIQVAAVFKRPFG